MTFRERSSDQLRIDLAGWLNEFPVSTRVKGRDYNARGLVSALEWVTDPAGSTIAAAAVRGSRDYECTLRHDPRVGWTGECSCPVGLECKHLYATGTALLYSLSNDREPAVEPPTSRAPTAPPEEEELVARFTTATGAAPKRKQLAWLRNLLRLFHSVRSGSPYFDAQAMLDLLPSSHRHGVFSYYNSPLRDRWSHPPASPLELWSHLALLFTEKSLPLPDFMARLTDLAWARAAVAAHRRDRELAAWRGRFSALAESIASASASDAPAPALRHLRLRLAAKKAVWEISAPESAVGAERFVPIAVNELRDYLYAPDEAAFELAATSLALAALLRVRLSRSNRLALKLSEADDRAFLARLLLHPHARACVVADHGEPFVRDPRRLVWQVRDHPDDPDLTLAHLAFADGTPAPTPLLHLPGRPDLYLHGATIFAGLPPPATDLSTPAAIPRAALALPEAGRFAVQAGIALPGDAAGRFRRESLRPRLRARLDRRRPGRTDPHDEVVLLELAALAPDGTPRAIYDDGAWRRNGPGLPPPSTDHAFLVLDYEPTRAAVEQFRHLPTFLDAWHPEGPRVHAEISAANFPDTFSTWLAGFPSDTIIELAPELAAFTQDPTRARFDLDLTPGDEAGIDWFDVRVTLRAEDTTLTVEEIALLHAARGRFVRLAGRGWRRLALDDSPAAQEKLARLGLDAAAAAGTAREPLRFHALQLADEALKEALPEKLWGQVCARSAALRATAPPELPAGLVADLRPYQQEGFHFLAFLAENKFGGILADDMGLGKTLQTLTWLLWLAARDPAKAKSFRVLVVCPKSVVVNWQLETARFAPGLAATPFTPALVAPAGAAKSGARLVEFDAQLLVANYAQLRLNAEALASVAWDAVILDEGQNIKNPASATAQAARALRSAHRLVLTGTPIENRLLDLWSLFAFAQPGLLGGQTAFKRLHNDKADPAGARSRLALRVKHFLLRRTKSQVARDLPPRIEDELVVELEGAQRTLYDAELKRTRALLLGVKNSRDFDTQRFNILQSLLRLRQICCDPRLLGVDAPPKSARRKAGTSKSRANAPDMPNSLPPPSAKLEALLDALEPLIAEGHKVLVFSQFVTMLELIRVELTARGIAHLMLTGQTENRQQLVDTFQADPAITVFLLSLKAAGSGLNLTAASYVVLFDPWWNPAVEAQAIDRTHRIGQKNQVIAYRLLARGTVEEKIRALQKEKAALAAAVMQEESLASVLDLESLRRILA